MQAGNGKFIFTIVVSFVFAILAIAGLPLQYTVGFLVAILIAFVFISSPLKFLFGMFLLRPALDEFFVSVRIPLGGADMGLGGLVSLVMIVGALFNWLVSPKKSWRLNHLLFYLYAVFCLVQVGTFFISYDKVSATKILISYFSTLSILVLTLLSVNSQKDAFFLAKGMVLSALLPVIIGFVKFGLLGGRFIATFSHPNIFAYYILVVFGIVVFQMDKSSVNLRPSVFRSMYLLLLVVVLVLTQTRSGWAAFLFMGGIYVLLYNRRMIFPSVFVLIVLGLTPMIQERVGSIFGSYGSTVVVSDESSLAWRFRQWTDLFGKAVRRPLTGYGIRADVFLSKEQSAAHNDYLRYFVESGLPGVLSYFMPYFYLFARVLRTRHLQGTVPLAVLESKISRFFVCYIPAFLAMSISENLASYLVIHWYVWGLIGIYLSCPNLRRQEATVSTRPHAQEGLWDEE